MQLLIRVGRRKALWAVANNRQKYPLGRTVTFRGRQYTVKAVGREGLNPVVDLRRS